MSVVARNADLLVRDPGRIFGLGQCYPLDGALALGEHMIGEGVLAAVPRWLTGEPILAYNVALLLKLWIAGLGMFLFARDLTGRAGAAFVAGLAFELSPPHLADLVHPYLSGDHFTPAAAFFLRRFVVRGGGRDALGLALCGTMTMLESLYSLVASGIILGTYAVHLAWRYRSQIARRWLLLVAILAWAGLVARTVFGPYLALRASIGVLAGRAALLGVVGLLPSLHLAAILSGVGLADRMRGKRARDGDDPRLAFLVAGAVSTWFGHRLAVGGLVIPSAYDALAGVVPGFDAVRAPGLMGQSVWFVSALLSAFGVLALLETRRTPAFARLATAVLAGALFVERATPAASALVFLRPFAPSAWEARPPEEDLRLLRRTTGPIVHVPTLAVGYGVLASADRLRLVAFDGRDTSACYNSFASPLVAQVGALARGLPASAAADALHALGFETVLVHVDEIGPFRRAAFEQGLTKPGVEGRLVEIGSTERLRAYALKSPQAVRSDPGVLVPQLPLQRATVQRVAARSRVVVRFVVRNSSNETYLHPGPLVPTAVRVRWLRGGVEVARDDLRTMLPVAIGARARETLEVELESPGPGEYRVVLSSIGDRPNPIAFETVVVDASAERDATL